MAKKKRKNKKPLRRAAGGVCEGRGASTLPARARASRALLALLLLLGGAAKNDHGEVGEKRCVEVHWTTQNGGASRRRPQKNKRVGPFLDVTIPK
jgi:hypothetical protein